MSCSKEQLHGNGNFLYYVYMSGLAVLRSSSSSNIGYDYGATCRAYYMYSNSSKASFCPHLHTEHEK